MHINTVTWRHCSCVYTVDESLLSEWSQLTGQFAVVQFEPVEGVGAVEQHVPLCVHRLQLLQGGFTASDALREHSMFIRLSETLRETDSAWR